MGTKVRVVIDKEICNQHSAMGLYTNGVIVMLPEYNSRTEFVDTFTHECFHALCATLGAQLDPNLEEILANTLGQSNIKIINAMIKNGVFSEEPSSE